VAANTVPVVPVVTKAAEVPNIAELVSTNPKFSTLLAAVKAADLVDVLSSEGPFTVFAPTNSAFDKVPADALNALLADKEKLNADAESTFKTEVEKLQKAYEGLQKAKDATLEEVKESGLGLMKAVKAHKKKNGGKAEL